MRWRHGFPIGETVAFCFWMSQDSLLRVFVSKATKRVLWSLKTCREKSLFSWAKRSVYLPTCIIFSQIKFVFYSHTTTFTDFCYEYLKKSERKHTNKKYLTNEWWQMFAETNDLLLFILCPHIYRDLFVTLKKFVCISKYNFKAWM